MEPPPGLWRNVALAHRGLSGATIRTIQIAGPATHARYAGWSQWHVRKLSRCLLIGRSNDACILSAHGRLAQSWSRPIETELRGPRPGPSGQRPGARRAA